MMVRLNARRRSARSNCVVSRICVGCRCKLDVVMVRVGVLGGERKRQCFIFLWD